MTEWKEERQTVEIPKGVGRQGFLLALEEILKQPRIQGIQIDIKGRVSYSRFVREGEESLPIKIDFESLSPYAVLRNTDVVELPLPSGSNAGNVVAFILNQLCVESLNPIAWVGSPNSRVWPWFEKTTGILPASRKEFFGFPFYADRMIEDYMLFVCAGYVRDAALIDTKKAYKIILPQEYV